MTITGNFCDFSWFHISWSLKNCPSAKCKNATDLILWTMALSENKMSHSLKFQFDAVGLLLFCDNLCNFLDFRRAHKISESDYQFRLVCVSVCLSVRMENLGFLLDRFSWNLIFEEFTKLCQENSTFIKIWQA